LFNEPSTSSPLGGTQEDGGLDRQRPSTHSGQRHETHRTWTRAVPQWPLGDVRCTLALAQQASPWSHLQHKQSASATQPLCPSRNGRCSARIERRERTVGDTTFDGLFVRRRHVARVCFSLGLMLSRASFRRSWFSNENGKRTGRRIGREIRGRGCFDR